MDRVGRRPERGDDVGPDRRNPIERGEGGGLCGDLLGDQAPGDPLSDGRVEGSGLRAAQPGSVRAEWAKRREDPSAVRRVGVSASPKAERRRSAFGWDVWRHVGVTRRSSRRVLAQDQQRGGDERGEVRPREPRRRA